MDCLFSIKGLLSIKYGLSFCLSLYRLQATIVFRTVTSKTEIDIAIIEMLMRLENIIKSVLSLVSVWSELRSYSVW